MRVRIPERVFLPREEDVFPLHGGPGVKPGAVVHGKVFVKRYRVIDERALVLRVPRLRAVRAALLGGVNPMPPDKRAAEIDKHACLDTVASVVAVRVRDLVDDEARRDAVTLHTQVNVEVFMSVHDDQAIPPPPSFLKGYSSHPNSSFLDGSRSVSCPAC